MTQELTSSHTILRKDYAPFFILAMISGSLPTLETFLIPEQLHLHSSDTVLGTLTKLLS